MGQGPKAGRGILLAVLSVASLLATPARGQAPPPMGYGIHTVGLIGPAYGAPSNLANVPPLGAFVTPTGQVAGASTRLNSLGDDAWFFNGTATQQIGLTGAGYEYTSVNGLYRRSVGEWLSPSGVVGGIAERYAADGTNLGYDSWRFNGSSTQLSNPTGVGFAYTTAAGMIRRAQDTYIDNAGRLFGYSNRYASDGTDLGADAWRFDGTSPQVIGLSGAVYQTTVAGGAFRTNYPEAYNLAGQAVGSTQRFAANGDILGSDAWLFNGSSSLAIGPTGGLYEYPAAGGTYRSSTAVKINPSGRVGGQAERFSAAGDPLGTDAFVYDGGVTTPAINLTGGAYEYSVTGGTSRFGAALEVAAGGQVVGRSDRFASNGDDLGSDLWHYDGTTTRLVNLTGSGYEYTIAGGVFRRGNTSGNAQSVNPTGHVMGDSYRYAPDGTEVGQDNFYFNGTTSQRINLAGVGYEYNFAGRVYRSSFKGGLTPSNTASGSSARYASNGSSLGTDVWYFNGTATQHAGPTGSTYLKLTPDGLQRDEAMVNMNDNGQIVGTAARYDPVGNDLGQAGWFFDPSGSTSTPLEFSFRNDGFVYTSPQLLSDTGVVLGWYDQFSGATLVGERAFWWSPAGGFHDLGSMVNGGLNAAGWDFLRETIDQEGIAAGGSPAYILGHGVSNSPSDVFLLSASIPEPASASLALAGGVGLLTLLARRSRK